MDMTATMQDPLPVLVAGLINMETTLRVDSFPVEYEPVRFPFFGIHSSVSGVGFNLAKALTLLGHPVRLAALVGKDLAGADVREALVQAGVDAGYVLATLQETPQSVILYDESGRRLIHTDLKDIQERVYPRERMVQAWHGCGLAVLCNINFTRPYLRLARQAGVLIATDVHTIADLEDEYNRDFMAAADILFMSNERLPCGPEEWVRRLQERYHAAIIGVGMGSRGALLAVRESGRIELFPAVATRPVVNSIGAGDALFAAFLHRYLTTGDPYRAMSDAVVFASYKIGETGAAAGFLSPRELDVWVKRVLDRSEETGSHPSA